MQSKASAWVGNAQTSDGTVAAGESAVEFAAASAFTTTNGACQIGAAPGAGNTVTYEIVDSSGTRVGTWGCAISGATATTGTGSGSSTLTAGSLYAVKAVATAGTGTIPAKTGWWQFF
jgi:hypothetical protein